VWFVSVGTKHKDIDIYAVVLYVELDPRRGSGGGLVVGDEDLPQPWDEGRWVLATG